MAGVKGKSGAYARTVLYTIRCEHCGCKVEAKRPSKRFCSSRCINLALRASGKHYRKQKQPEWTIHPGIKQQKTLGSGDGW